jgi:glycerol-1-phosphatase
VMTGVTDLADLCGAPPGQRPTYVAWTLRGLLASHEAPRTLDGSWSLGGWSVRVRDATVRIEASGSDRDDGLKAVVGACWAAHDEDPDSQLRFDDLCQALGRIP